MSAVGTDELAEAIDSLQVLIAKRVRREQRRDHLTGLPNNLAMMDELAERISERSKDGVEFWVAFIEVDRFKSLNSRFGHVNADAVLQRIAATMDTMCHCFSMKTLAFRAHGDEFFYVGRGSEDSIEKALEAIRLAISEIKITIEGSAKAVMSCTVSVGWLTSDVWSSTLLTERLVLEAAERAVSQAKVKRDAVVRYTSSMKPEDWVPLRTDCSACECRFSMDVKRGSLSKKKLNCPNCGKKLDRPPVPEMTPASEVSEPQTI